MKKYFNWLYPRFSLYSKIEWKCPYCNIGGLTIDKEKFFFEETIQSQNEHNHIEWEVSWIRYNFVGILRCTNDKCREIVTVGGIGTMEESGYVDEKLDKYVEEYNEYFTPQYFNPPLLAFVPTNNCPNNIREEIEKAFSLFWIDISACANRLRTSIELIMNDHKIPKTTLTKNEIKLHGRITLFGKEYPVISEYLLAIKWLGNSGSHSTDTLEKQDLIDAFKMLEIALEKIYDNREEEIMNISKIINETKKPRSVRNNSINETPEF